MTKLEELLKAHWDYVYSTLKIHDAHENEIAIAEFHYKTAFRHGWKHAAQEADPLDELLKDWAPLEDDAWSHFSTYNACFCDICQGEKAHG